MRTLNPPVNLIEPISMRANTKKQFKLRRRKWLRKSSESKRFETSEKAPIRRHRQLLHVTEQAGSDVCFWGRFVCRVSGNTNAFPVAHFACLSCRPWLTLAVV
jgi:hypothetical protein